jgi:integrase
MRTKDEGIAGQGRDGRRRRKELPRVCSPGRLHPFQRRAVDQAQECAASDRPRILREHEVSDLIRHANPGRDRLMLQVAYFGGLRVSEFVSLTWAHVMRRHNGGAQLSIIGKGDKACEVLIPTTIAGPLLASRGDAPASAPVFAHISCPRVGHMFALQYIDVASAPPRSASGD